MCGGPLFQKENKRKQETSKTYACALMFLQIIFGCVFIFKM